MRLCEWELGEPEIVPYAPLQFDPASALHYGQAIFEGMKAYKDDKGDVFLFRPDQNIKRLNKSAERLAIPQFPEKLFLEGLHKLIDLERDWVQQVLVIHYMSDLLYLRVSHAYRHPLPNSIDY